MAGGRKLTDIIVLAEVGLLLDATELEALPGLLMELLPVPGLLTELRPLPGILAERGGDLEPAEFRLIRDECREGGGVEGGA